MPWVGAEAPFIIGASQLFGAASRVFRWGPTDRQYQGFNAAGPTVANTLTTLFPLDGLWVFVASDETRTWDQPGLPPVVP